MASMWTIARDRLIAKVQELGFPPELGEEMAKNLGSPKAIDRMSAYLEYEKPQSAEMIVDEMLAICSEIDVWRKKKEAQEANARYNQILFEGLDSE